MFRWESPARTRAYVWEVTLLLSDILIVFVSDDDDDDDDEDDDDDDTTHTFLVQHLQEETFTSYRPIVSIIHVDAKMFNK